MTRTQGLVCALKAAAAATGMLLLSVFVFEPLDSLGFVDLGESKAGAFGPNYVALALIVVPFWLLFFWAFFVLFWARGGMFQRKRAPTSE